MRRQLTVREKIAGKTLTMYRLECDRDEEIISEEGLFVDDEEFHDYAYTRCDKHYYRAEKLMVVGHKRGRDIMAWIKVPYKY